MADQQKSDDAKEPLSSEPEISEATKESSAALQSGDEAQSSHGAPAARWHLSEDNDVEKPLLPVVHKSGSTELTSPGHLNAANSPAPAYETEWIPGEHLPLLRIPHPTVWPVTLALGVTGMAFGVVTHWILSVAGLFLFLLGAAGWIEDLRKDVLQ